MELRKVAVNWLSNVHHPLTFPFLGSVFSTRGELVRDAFSACDMYRDLLIKRSTTDGLEGAYLGLMQKSGVWMGEVEAYAIAAAFGVQVRIYASTPKAVRISDASLVPQYQFVPAESDPIHTVRLLHHKTRAGSMHYVPWLLDTELDALVESATFRLCLLRSAVSLSEYLFKMEK